MGKYKRKKGITLKDINIGDYVLIKKDLHIFWSNNDFLTMGTVLKITDITNDMPVDNNKTWICLTNKDVKYYNAFISVYWGDLKNNIIIKDKKIIWD